MAELVIGMMYAMVAVLAVSVAVWFGIRGARYGRGYQKEEHGEKTAE